jgi:hypothetical protein
MEASSLGFLLCSFIATGMATGLDSSILNIAKIVRM